MLNPEIKVKINGKWEELKPDSNEEREIIFKIDGEEFSIKVIYKDYFEGIQIGDDYDSAEIKVEECRIGNTIYENETITTGGKLKLKPRLH